MPVLGSILAAAFLVRLVYLLEYRHSLFFTFPVIDSATYDRMAWDAAQGRRLWPGAFWQPPLYPWLLGLFYTVAGHTLFGARLVQITLGSLSCLLLYFVGRRVFGPPTGNIAAAGMALYGTLIYFDGEILVPTLSIFLLLAGLLLLLRAADAGAERPCLLLWLSAGLVLGLAALARPDALLFGVVAAAWAWGWPGRNARWVRVRRVGLFLLGVCAVVSVVTVRNYLVAGDLVLISANGGLNFYLGNNPEAEAMVAVRPGFRWESLVNEPYLKAGISKASARSLYFFQKGLTFLRTNPGAALALYGRKLARFWNAFEIGRNRDVYGTRGDSRLLSVLLWRLGPVGFPFGIVAPLAAVGLTVSLSRDRKRVLLYLFLLAYLLATILFFVAARYRLAIVPVLLLFAAYYIVWLRAALRQGRRRRVLMSLVLLAVVFPLVNRGFPAFDRLYRGEADRYRGIYYVDRGQYEAGEAAYRRAIEADPDYAEAHAELGQLLRDRGRQAEALTHLRRAYDLCPFSEQTQYLLGTAYAAAGESAEAEAWFRKAIAAAPYALAHRDLGRLLLDEGRLAEAEQWLRQAAELNPDDLETWYKLGQCLVYRGRYAEAERALHEARRLAPGDREIGEKIEALRRLQARSR